MSNLFIVKSSAPSTPTTPYVVQIPVHNVSSSSASSLSVTYAINVAAGNCLIATIGYRDATTSVTSVHDNLNSPNWTLAGTLKQGNGLTAGIYFYNNTLGGACTVTVTLSTTTTFLDIAVLEVYNLTGVVDVSSSATFATASTGVSPGSLTTTSPNDFVISYGAITTAAGTMQGANGYAFSLLSTSNNVLQYAIAPTAGAYNPSFTDGSTNHAWALSAVAFKAATNPVLNNIVVVQPLKGIGSSAGVFTLSVTFNANVTAGNSLIGGFCYYAGFSPTISDNLNGNWTPVALNFANSSTAAIYWIPSTLGGACTVTITLPTNAPAFTIGVMEVKGLTGQVEATNSNTAAGSSTASAGNLTVWTPNDFLFAVDAPSSYAWAGASGWNFWEISPAGGAFQYLIPIGTPSPTNTYVPTFSNSGTWSAVSAAFYSQAAAHSGLPPIEAQKFRASYAIGNLQYNNIPAESQQFQASYVIGDFQYNNIPAESQKFQASYSITTFTYA